MGLPCFASLLRPSLSPSWAAPRAGFPFPSQDKHRSGFLLHSQWCFCSITSSVVCFSLLHLPLPPHGCRLFFFGPFTKTGSQLVFPHWRKSAQRRSWVRFRIPIANSQSPLVTQKGAQQTSVQLPASKHPQEYSLFLSIAPPLLPSHTEITYPSIFPWEKTNQPESHDFQKAIIDYLAVATRNVSRKLVLLNAPGHTQRFVSLAGLQFAFVLPKCKCCCGPAENIPVAPTL